MGKCKDEMIKLIKWRSRKGIYNIKKSETHYDTIRKMFFKFGNMIKKKIYYHIV